MSILLYGCTTWTLIYGWRKSLTATTQECCEQYWTSHGGNTPQSSSCTSTYHPITKTIKIRRTRHQEHCWGSRDEPISDVLLWTPSHGRAKAGRSARIYIQQLCEGTGCSPEDLPKAMTYREGWRGEGQGYPCWRCSWCNGYRRRNWTRRLEFKILDWLHFT